jgi:hypothetical protein
MQLGKTPEKKQNKCQEKIWVEVSNTTVQKQALKEAFIKFRIHVTWACLKKVCED